MVMLPATMEGGVTECATRTNGIAKPASAQLFPEVVAGKVVGEETPEREYCAYPSWSPEFSVEAVNPAPAVKVPELSKSVTPTKKLPVEKAVDEVDMGEADP